MNELWPRFSVQIENGGWASNEHGVREPRHAPLTRRSVGGPLSGRIRFGAAPGPNGRAHTSRRPECWRRLEARLAKPTRGPSLALSIRANDPDHLLQDVGADTPRRVQAR